MLIHFTQADIEAAIGAVVRSRLDPNQNVDLVFTFTSGRNTKKRQGNGTSAQIVTVDRVEVDAVSTNDSVLFCERMTGDLFNQNDHVDDVVSDVDYTEAHLLNDTVEVVSVEATPYVVVTETTEEYETKHEEAVQATPTRSLFNNLRSAEV